MDEPAHLGRLALDSSEAPEPVAEAAPATPTSSLDLKAVFLGGLFVLGCLASLYAAREIALPIALAVILKLLLQPAVRIGERFHVPKVIGAVCALGLVFGLVFGLGAVLSGPASSWAAKLPAGLPRLEERLSFLKQPFDALHRILSQAERVVQLPAAPETPVVAVQQSPGFADSLFAGARSVADGLFTTVIVLFFLLCAGDLFLRRLVELMPTLNDKRQVIEISHQIERHISAYLSTITLINIAVGACTAAIAWACGLSDPLLWGVLAYLMNYVPILGPLTVFGIILMVGFISFDTLYQAVLPAALFLALHIAEGEAITPMLVARRFTLNPVIVVLAFVFWYWMWGIPGAILAVPMLAVVKIVSDQVPALAAFGRFLEG